MPTCKLISKLGSSTSKTLNTVAVHYRKLAWNTMCQSISNIHLECLGSEARTFQKRKQERDVQQEILKAISSRVGGFKLSYCRTIFASWDNLPKQKFSLQHVQTTTRVWFQKIGHTYNLLLVCTHPFWETNFDQSQPATEPIASNVPSASAVEAAKSAATDFLRRSQLNHKKKPRSIYGWGVWKQYRQWPKKWWKMCQPLVDIDLDIVCWWPVVSWLNASQCFFYIFPSYHMIWRVLKMRDPNGFNTKPYPSQI